MMTGKVVGLGFEIISMLDSYFLIKIPINSLSIIDMSMKFLNALLMWNTNAFPI